MKNSNNILIIALAAALFYILWSEGCGESGEYIQSTDTVTVTNTIIVPGDSIPYEVEVPVPVIRWKERVVEVPVDIDTNAILFAYFTKHFYSDTVTDDTSMSVIINDSVHKNEIFYRKVYFQNLRAKSITTNTTTVTTIKKFSWNKVFVGAEIGVLDLKPIVGVGVMVQNKKDNLVGATYHPFNKGIMVKYYGKIHFRWLQRKKTVR